MPRLPHDDPAGAEAEPTAPPEVPHPGPTQPFAPRTDGTAVAALVVAILSWFVIPVVGAIVALVLARGAERSITARPAELTGAGLVSGARWVAWVHLLLVAMVVAFISAFVIAVWIGQ